MKFKIGDKVRCLMDCEPGRQFTKGKIYTVIKFPDQFGYVCVDEDDKGSNINGLHPRYFELVKETKKFQVGDRVAVYGTDGNLKPIRIVSTVTEILGGNQEGLVYLDEKTAYSGPGDYDFTVSHVKNLRRVKSK